MAAFAAVSKSFPEGSPVSVVLPDIVVDGLVREFGTLPGPEQHLDLFGAEALVEELEDLGFEMAPDLAGSVLPAKESPALGEVGVVVTARKGVAPKFTGDGAGSPAEGTGHLADGSSMIAHGPDADTFCLAEVFVVGHWFGCLCDD